MVILPYVMSQEFYSLEKNHYNLKEISISIFFNILHLQTLRIIIRLLEPPRISKTNISNNN